MRKIDPTELIPLGEARRSLLPKVNGRPIAPSTLWRYHKKGCRARDGQLVRLRVTYFGNRPMVCREAIAEFIDELTRRNETVSQPTESSNVSARSPITEKRLRDNGLLPPDSPK